MKSYSKVALKVYEQANQLATSKDVYLWKKLLISFFSLINKYLYILFSTLLFISEGLSI